MDDLTDDVVISILQCVLQDADNDSRVFRWFRSSVPLVCTRWSVLLGSPSAIWQDVTVDIESEATRFSSCSAAQPKGGSPSRVKPCVVLGDQVVAWLRRRASAVRTLTLDLRAQHHTFSPRHFHQLCLVLRKSLRVLVLRSPNAMCSRDAWESLSFLKALSGLYLTECPVEFLEIGLPSLAFLPHLKSLSFSVAKDDLAEVRSLTFPTHLTSLHVANLCIHNLQQAPSVSPPKLASLSLDLCQIPNQDVFSIFAHPTTLKHLSINSTVHLPSHQLPDLPFLTSLQYTNSPFPKTPTFSTAPSTLISLDLSHNSPDRLPTTLPPTLQHLTLSHCSLATLPPLLSSTPSLTSLDLSHNSLPILPKTAPPFAATLRSLNISCNRLQSLTPWVWSCTHLTSLTASSTAAASTDSFESTVLSLPHLARLRLVGPSYDARLVRAVLRLSQHLASNPQPRLQLEIT